MDQSMDTYPDCLIIDRPDFRSRPTVFGEGVVTFIFWGFWFYLWLPFINLIAWWLGFQFFYIQMLELGGMVGFVEQIHVFSSGVALFSLSIAGWSVYNFKRYGSLRRRFNFLETDRRKLSNKFMIPAEIIEKMQEAKLIHFSFEEDRSIVQVGFLTSSTHQNNQLTCYSEAETTTINISG